MHVHFICPQIWKEAIANGITTLIGGGTGPADGSKATTCTSSEFYMKNMMAATDSVPLNFGFTGKGNDSGEKAIRDIVEAGACGLKIHEDWGATPEVIDRSLNVGDEYDVQVNIHTDTLNESGYVETTLAAIKGRTIHTYHTEGAGGGHAPDIIVVVEHPNVLPSSTNPTRPYAVNTLDEHLDVSARMMVKLTPDAHGLPPPRQVHSRRYRIRRFANSSRDRRCRGCPAGHRRDQHDQFGLASDGPNRRGCVQDVAHCVQDAGCAGYAGGRRGEERQSASQAIRRKVHHQPVSWAQPWAPVVDARAITHGVSHLVGQVAVGCLADLVMWKPENFGAKPELVIKGGMIAWSNVSTTSTLCIPLTADRRRERKYPDSPTIYQPADVGSRARRSAAQFRCVCQPGVRRARHQDEVWPRQED